MFSITFAVAFFCLAGLCFACMCIGLTINDNASHDSTAEKVSIVLTALGFIFAVLFVIAGIITKCLHI